MDPSGKLKSEINEKEMLNILNELGVKNDVIMTNVHLVPRILINKNNVDYYVKKSLSGFDEISPIFP